MSQEQITHTPSIEQLQKLHRRRMAIFGSIILIAGIAIGSASTVILIPPPKPTPGPNPIWLARVMSDRLEGILDLTSEQKEKIRLAFKTAFEGFEKVQTDAKPKIDKIFETMKDEISAVLTKEQNTRWQRDIEDHERRYGDRWRRGRRPGEGGPRPDGRRGPGDPNRDRWRSDDPNRPWRGFGPGDPNSPREGFRRGPGRFGPGDPNRPPSDFDSEAMRERFRRGDRPRPDEPPRPLLDMKSDPTADSNNAEE